jgi:hypothetical protein
MVYPHIGSEVVVSSYFKITKDYLMIIKCVLTLLLKTDHSYCPSLQLFFTYVLKQLFVINMPGACHCFTFLFYCSIALFFIDTIASQHEMVMIVSRLPISTAAMVIVQPLTA